ncbi:C40 family peptidase [Nonomuraea sp. NPDC050310]|uniref:C40 family peptidase n=1 Tax=unclassified Nonomuraea TaxID=2593643 RepID=UPI0033FD8CAD
MGGVVFGTALTGLTATPAQAVTNTPAAAPVTSSGTATVVTTTGRPAKIAWPAKAARSARAAKAARQKVRAAKAVAVAKAQIGDPYRFGATGPGSFDCSGLVQYAWRKAGIRIPRVTHSQYAGIRTKVSWRNLRPGDLMFFSGRGHVGMYVGKGRMVHSPRTGKTVRVEKLSGWRKRAFAGAVRPGG